MSRIKVDAHKAITITTIADFAIAGVTNLKLVKIVGTYIDETGFNQQTNKVTPITIIPNIYRVAWYEE